MNESDNDTADGRSENSVGDNLSEDETMDEAPSRTSSAPGTPGRRKRLRSSTPSELENDLTGSDSLRSPLSKRKKIAADRSGLSKLKEGITAGEIREETPDKDISNDSVAPSPSGGSEQEMGDEDDFLIGDMEVAEP